MNICINNSSSSSSTNQQGPWELSQMSRQQRLLAL
jgi:hypothetical protein